MTINDSHIEPQMTFRKLVFLNMQQLTNFPYIEKDFDALTDYQLLCKVVEYLNMVIKNSNDQNDSITSLYNAFISLQDYVNTNFDDLETAFNNLQTFVNNYFDNLDVQEEINNKLDEYVEDGTLEHIIASYLQTQKIYNTHTEMIADSSNLVDGLTVQTLGYYNINDGGGAFYKITDTESETEYQEEVGDLYATLIIKNNTYYIQQFGAKSDGITDSSNAINTCFSYAKKDSVIDCSGSYAINDTIILPTEENVYVKNGYFKSLSANGYFTLANTTDLRTYYTGYMLTIDNITLNGNYISNGLLLTKAFGVKVINSVFRNFLDFGIKIDDAESHDNIIDGCQFSGRDYSHAEVESTCLIINKPDNQVSNCIFSYAKWAIQMLSATNMITNCHFYCNDTISGGNLYLLGGIKLIDHCYFDGSGIYFVGSTNVVINNSMFLISDRTRGNLFNFHYEGTAQINGIIIKNAIVTDYRSDKTIDFELFSVDYNVSLANGNICEFRTLPPHIIQNNPAQIFTWEDSSEICFSTLEPVEIANINAQTSVISSHSTEGIDTYYDKVNVSSKMVETNYIGSDSIYRWVLIPFYISGKASVKFKNTSGSYEGRIYDSNYENVSTNGKYSTLTPGKYFYAAFRTQKAIINY